MGLDRLWQVSAQYFPSDLCETVEPASVIFRKAVSSPEQSVSPRAPSAAAQR